MLPSRSKSLASRLKPSISILGDKKYKPEIIIPALANMFLKPQTSGQYAQHEAIIGLPHYGPEARCAVPHLQKLLTARDFMVRESARSALRQIAPEILTNATAR